MNTQPEFIYAALVLPSLFALTLITEGLNKLLRHESGWVSVIGGVFFLSIVLTVYFIFLFK